MDRQTLSLANFTRILPRIALLAGMLAAPLFAVQSVQASSETVIESSYKMSNGAGLVIVFGLQRS